VLVLAAHGLAGCVVATSGLGTGDGGPAARDSRTARDTGGGAVDGGVLIDADGDAGPTRIDAGPEVTDAGGDRTDAGTDAGRLRLDAGTDTGPICVAMSEVCNARDDNCDGMVDESGCPCRRQTFGGHVYLFCSTGRTWADARSDCQSWGYDLVSIGGDAENELVRMNVTEDTWIGLNDRMTEGAYVWPDGSPFGYENWRSPDAPRGTPDTRDCVEIDAVSGDWLDVDCPGSRPFVCEVDPSP